MKPAQEELILIHPAIFSGMPGVVAFQTTRRGGFSARPYDSLNLGLRTQDDQLHVRKNLEHLCGQMSLRSGSVVLTDQVHGTSILRIDHPGHVSGYDALITDTPGIYPGIVTADCYPVLLHDREHRASGAVHAGWQGTAGHIAKKTVEAMGAAFGTRPEACVAWVGTGISSDCYEIGAEVAGRFDERYLRPSPCGEGRYLLDLSAANRDQLLAAGIPANQIECSSWCSSRDRDLFFSYRRDHGQTGRMLSMVGVRPSA